jgi:hypothetical protein
MIRSRARHLLVTTTALAAITVLAACSSTSSTSSGTPGSAAPASTAGGTTAPQGYPNDGTLKLNQIQTIGTHNSYHLRTPQALRDKIDTVIPGLSASWNYQLDPLEKQLDYGVRQFEIDVHLDPDTRFAKHSLMPLAGLPDDTPAEMTQPGLKVFHIQDLDFASSCLTFKACLTILTQWSATHPGHAPIMVLVEAKADPIPETPLPAQPEIKLAQSVKWDAGNLGQIDDEIKAVVKADQMITPDQVRGSYPTLEAAALANNWPTLGQSRGKFLFALDNDDLRSAYAQGHPSLQGRVMFADGPTGAPESAYIGQNNAADPPGKVDDLVKKGYLVRTLPDPDDVMIGKTETERRDISIKSGAHWLSTNYPVPDPSVGVTYTVTLPGGVTARCNPVTAPPTCKPTDIEDPALLTSYRRG